MTDAQGRYEAHDTPSRAGVLAGECRGWVMIKPQTPQEEQQFLNGKHPRLQELKPLLTKYGRLSTPLILAISSDKIEVDLVLD